MDVRHELFVAVNFILFQMLILIQVDIGWKTGMLYNGCKMAKQIRWQQVFEKVNLCEKERHLICLLLNLIDKTNARKFLVCFVGCSEHVCYLIFIRGHKNIIYNVKYILVYCSRLSYMRQMKHLSILGKTQSRDPN